MVSLSFDGNGTQKIEKPEVKSFKIIPKSPKEDIIEKMSTDSVSFSGKSLVVMLSI